MSTSSRSVARERATALATLLLLSLIAAGPVWGPGLLNTRGGGDSPFLLLRTHQLAANLRAGVFPARWMPDAAYGFGYPFFSYYAALPYYLAAGLTTVGLNILSAIKLTQTLFFAAASLAMFGWARHVLHSRPAAWLAAVAYASAPFFLVNVYVRGDSLSEFAAFTFFPLILWGLDRLARRPTVRRTVPPALAYAGLIVTHNVSALIFSPFILLYVAWHGWRLSLDAPQPRLRSSLAFAALLILPLIMALLLSAWFWLPALREMGYVQLDAQVTGYFFYANHFRGADLIQWRPIFDYREGLSRPTPFAMGLAQAVLAAAGALVVGARIVGRRRHRHGDRSRFDSNLSMRSQGPELWTLAFAALGLLLSTWLITPLSRPLWERLPLLPLTQFPWRFLSVQAVFAALLTGALICPLGGGPRSTTSWAAAAAVGGMVAAAALLGLRPQYLPISAEDVTVERLQLYELFTGNIGSTIRHEYLPRWVRPRPFTGPALLAPDAPARVFPVSGEVHQARRLQRDPTHRIWEVDVGDTGAEVAFPLYYWPGWQAAVDGVPADIEPAPASGYLSLSIPPGLHTVEIWLGRTPLRLWCEMASLVGAAAVLAMAILGWPRGLQQHVEGEDRTASPRRRTTTSAIRDVESLVAFVPFVILLALLVAFHPGVDGPEGQSLTMDFEGMPYLHPNPDGVVFDSWRMVGYEYDAETLTPGETLLVTLDWETMGTDGATAELRLVSPAAIRETLVRPVAQTTVTLSDQEDGDGRGRATAMLSIPQEVAPGLHFPQVVSERSITLRPVWIGAVDTPANRPVLAAFVEGAARLHGIEAVHSAPDQLSVQLDWSAGEPMSGNYGLRLSLTDPWANEWLHQGGQPGYNTQPGHGFLPTSLWPVDRLIHDRHTAALQRGAPPSDEYVLTVELYDVGTWESVGEYATRVRLTEVTRRPDAPIVARLGDELALSRLEVPHSVWQGDRLAATAYWVAVERPSRDYVAEWRLETPEHSITSTQPLAPGSPPADWPVTAWIAGRTQLSVPPTAPPGAYRLELTLRDAVSGVAIGSYTHSETVEIRERERVWALPPMDRVVGARFGGMIELGGYDIRQRKESIHLTLHWQALTTPDQHYMFFVHLADPESGQPVMQVDEMPRGFTYPTGIWVPGEVVSDEVRLPLQDAPGGRYDLAIGWYDPDSRVRLQAVDSEGTPLPEDRLILPDGITLP